jgi:hypothetical protein
MLIWHIFVCDIASLEPVFKKTVFSTFYYVTSADLLKYFSIISDTED